MKRHFISSLPFHANAWHIHHSKPFTSYFVCFWWQFDIEQNNRIQLWNVKLFLCITFAFACVNVSIMAGWLPFYASQSSLLPSHVHSYDAPRRRMVFFSCGNMHRSNYYSIWHHKFSLLSPAGNYLSLSLLQVVEEPQKFHYFCYLALKTFTIYINSHCEAQRDLIIFESGQISNRIRSDHTGIRNILRNITINDTRTFFLVQSKPSVRFI